MTNRHTSYDLKQMQTSLKSALTAAMKYDMINKLYEEEYTLTEAISIVNEVSDRFSRLLDEVIKDGSVRR